MLKVSNYVIELLVDKVDVDSCDPSGSKRGWEVQNNMKWTEVIAAHAVPEEPYMIRAITLSLYNI